MEKRFNLKAYRRNIRAAFKADGKRPPNGYSTAIASNGDFVVYNSAMGIVARLPKGQWEEFYA